MGPQRAPGAGGTSLVGSSDSYNRLARRRLEGSRTPIIDFIKSQLPAYVRNRYLATGVTLPRLSVGTPGVAVSSTGVGVPGVVPGATTNAPPSVPPSIDRRDVTSVTGNLSPETKVVVQAKDWFEYWELKNQGIAVSEPSRGGASSVQTSPGGSDMDLGTLATDLLKTAGEAYIRKEFGTGGGMGYADFPSFLPDIDLGVPGPGVFTPDMQACGGASPVYKKVCGQYKWVTPKKRRRKRLATQSDLKDLAALKGILGNGKAFETWIATHS